MKPHPQRACTPLEVLEVAAISGELGYAHPGPYDAVRVDDWPAVRWCVNCGWLVFAKKYRTGVLGDGQERSIYLLTAAGRNALADANT